MSRIVMIHNRPNENDCFDDFARYYASRGLEYCHWRDIPRGPFKYACCMQDPVGRVKTRAIDLATVDAIEVLNHPDKANASRRQELYPKWRAAGIQCPDDPIQFDYDRMVSEARYPYLVKDLSKQMGRGFVIDSRKRLDWLYLESARFDVDRFWTLPFVSLRNPDGYAELHRYVVAGGRVLPGVYAKTRSWNCKASHMAREIKEWSDDRRQQYANELEAFWRSTPHPDIARAVEIAGLDFCLVDATLKADGTPFFWELNPMANMRPAEVAGKQTTWWRHLASWLLPGYCEQVEWPSGWAQVENLLNWKGYKTYWAKEKEEEQ